MALKKTRLSVGAFSIEPVGPFSWEAARDVLSRWAPVQHLLPDPEGPVRGAFLLDGDFVPVAVRLAWADGALRGECLGPAERVERQVARMFSLDRDASGYPQLAERDPKIGALMAALPGLRPVLFPSVYEAAVWAVLSQRIPMRQAARVQAQLAEAAGEPISFQGGTFRAFPSPAQVLAAKEHPGLPEEKSERLRAVAKAALEGLLDPQRLLALGDEEAPRVLQRIRGIGPFWASGIYLRACGVADVFPDEPRSIEALCSLHGLSGVPDAAALAELTGRYRPFRMWGAFLLRVAAGRGLIPGLDGGPPARGHGDRRPPLGVTTAARSRRKKGS